MATGEAGINKLRDALELAWKDYERAVEGIDRAYGEAITPARKAFNKAIEEAWVAYEGTVRNS